MYRLIIIFFLLECVISFRRGHAQTNEGTGILTGQVRSVVTKDGVPSANITILSTTRGVVCDEEGRFILKDLPFGVYQVRASSFGYQSHIETDVVISGSKPTELIFELNEQDVELAQVDVVADYFQKSPDVPLSTLNQSYEEIRRLPGGLEDVVRAISILPGVAQVQAGRNDLIVRGGAPSENLYLVDNIEVPNINHFGTQGASGGPLSYINLDFVDNTTFSTGGFGVRYGDKLSSVLSIDLRNGRNDRLGGKATISASQFGLNVEGPVSNNSSFIFSARRSYLDFIFRAAGFGFVPEYWDFLGKVNYNPGPHDQISILGIGVMDHVRMFNDTEKQRFDNSRILYSDQHQLVSGVSWKHIFSNGYSLLSLGSTYADFDYHQNDTTLTSVFRNTSAEYEVGIRGEVAIQLSRTTEFSTGIHLKHIKFFTDITIPPFRTSTGESLDVNTSYRTRASKSVLFLQLSHQLTKLRAIIGGRLDYFDLITNKVAFSPRLALSYALTPLSTITGSAGIYYQAPSYIWLVSDPLNRDLSFARVHQYVLGFENLLQSDLRFSLEGYYKFYSKYPASLTRPYLIMVNTGAGYGGSTEGFASFGTDHLASIGSGSARGAEISVQKKATDDRLYGTFSISYNESRFTALDGIERPSNYDQRWIINIGGGYMFDERWEVSMKFRYATGRPYTPFNSDGTQDPLFTNTARIRPNHSLDVRADRRWMFSRWTLITYIDIQNVYNRKPVDIPRYNELTHQIEESGSIGILPSAGISVEF